MGKARGIKRFFEIVPAAASWTVIASLVALAIFKPVACAVSIISFDFYWIIRTCYLTTLLFMSHRKLFRQMDKDWLKECLDSGKDWQDIYHLIIFPVYKEGPEVLSPSLRALQEVRYPKDKIIVVVSFEERNPKAKETAGTLENEFKDKFFRYVSTFHPDGLLQESKIKGANATWAAKRARELLDVDGIPYEKAIISCFDADTCVASGYLACLTYHFLTSDKPHQASYQPAPVYNNNIWQAPSFARLVEISSSFCQMIESMRLEKFVTFSSHSMSFKTLVDIDYWPLDMISDDSVIYWKAYLYFNGDYRVIPLYTTVSMDVAYSDNFIKTIAVQYKQKRRWAWGVENFPFVAEGFLRNEKIPLLTKVRRSFNLLESHLTWAVWSVILTIIAPLPLLLHGRIFSSMAIGYNLPRIAGILLNLTLATSLIWVVLSRAILPPRPKNVSWTKNIVMMVEWILVPFIVLVLGSPPALDAQTRLMLAKYMEFNPTEKRK
jgi:cellulose synthase/poly-beta-1,6-N-acetylglucosamine synthase-like glycosyltransferase